MRISDSLAESLLVKSGKFTKHQLDDLQALSLKTNKPLQDLIITTGLLSETELTRLYAEELHLPFIELSADAINRRAITHLPEHVANRYKAVVFDIDDGGGGSILVAMEDPSDEQAIAFLQKQLGNNLKLHVTSSSLLEAALAQYPNSARPNHLLHAMGYSSGASDSLPVIPGSAVADGSAARESVNQILARALQAGASDIHIEPQIDHVAIRYRTDGLLRTAHKLPASALDPLLTHIKTTSRLKPSEHYAPQHGQWSVSAGDQHYKVRVTILPTIDGEKAVLHIVHESSSVPSLRYLGLWGSALQVLQRAVTEPSGTLLIVGPVNSGKSTTLFSLLSALNSPSLNIATIEDPVEYRIAGANQFQINPASGITSAAALQTILKQDPNIIMLSEINDSKLARLAIQASSKGHLVLFTLHTPSAAAGIHRLLDMDIEPFLISSSLRAIVGQRLARRLCQSCREAITPTKALLEQIEKSIQPKNYGGFKRLHELESLAAEEGVGGTKTAPSQLSSSSRGINRLWKAHEGGCSHCDNTGYHGRIGIFEVLAPSVAVQKTINHRSSVRTIHQVDD